ncbi:hypothetical protein [Pelagerythrobacter marinus]|jgi:hypothetical protein|uniref:hypothetical protein n=1 Tax=Pelagerythrobacter marinus TaxID=538382 RepID=UPI00203729A4|nr:hypothetical protein [Pelagerythrobacter marinus]USA40589.1 hypothetical protein NCF86_05400 [Pelagerythrobacter marinus]WPZ08240.1 hypothetical protein T8T98_06955 [Pelagerythrobacter marinus]
MTRTLFDQWAAEGASARFTPGDALADRRTRFERRVRRRNLTEYAAGALVIPVFAWTAWLTARAGEIVLAAGWLAGIVGMVVVLCGLYYRAGNLPHRPEVDCRSHLRAQLVHQRDALASVPRWYLAPLVPGLALVTVGSVLPIARAEGWIVASLAAAGPLALIAGVFAGIAWLNRRAARELAREIEALDSAAGSAAGVSNDRAAPRPPHD